MALRDERLKSTVGGKYRIVRFLAEGGMGAVYEAHHLIVKRRFAVKFLRADLARRRDVLQRFKREAEATGALEAENIAAAVDFGIADGGAPYIVMEYLDGVDLGTLLSREGPLPVPRAADLVTQACLGMQAAHAAGVVHRDLKPRNLFVCRRSDGTDLLKIVDFGVAKLLAVDPTSQVTRTGSMVGTPSYMSPEQARGETDVDARGDVYALGVILYELLSGHTPHRGDSFNAVIHNIATQAPMPLRCEGRDFAPELERLVARALSSDPAARQASAGQLAEELAPFAGRQRWPDRAERPVPVEDVWSPEGSDQAAPSTRTRLLKPSSLLVAAALLGVIWLAARSSTSRQTTSERGTVPKGELVVSIRSATPSPRPPPAAPADARSAAPSPAATIATDAIPARALSRHSDKTTNARTPGRPPRATTTSSPASNHVASDSVVATFDTQNPYD